MQTMVLVYAPIGEAQSVGFGSAFPTPSNSPSLKSEVVGILPYDAPFTGNHERLTAEVKSHGCELDVICRVSSNTPGYIGANIAIRVAAPTMAIARDLPGFVPLYMHSGDQYYVHLNLIHEPGKPVHDDNVVQEFRMPEDAPRPKYGDDDASVESMIPQGQLASVVFLREKPDSWFQVSGCRISREDVIKAARSLVG